jgi:hypothetical protein
MILRSSVLSSFRSGATARSSAERMSPISCRAATKSPLAALLANCFNAASSFVTFFRTPLSVITIYSSKISVRTVVKLRLPFGRPFRFPEIPLRNRLFVGGFRYPTS